MENNLSLFGEQFIKSVRDNTLFVLEGIISGHMKSTQDQEMYSFIKNMPEEQQQFLRDFSYRMVDLTLHNTLFFFESTPDWNVKDEGNESLSEVSDGLSGELYTEDGWINKYSDYPPSKGL